MVHMNQTINEEIADNVRRLIRNEDRTKVSIADESGIPYPTFKRRLSGKSDFRVSELVYIAEALGVTPAEILPASLVAR